MEMAVAKPFMMLSAYLMTAATVSPPRACHMERERQQTMEIDGAERVKFLIHNETHQ